jgi:hypothetical protein
VADREFPYAPGPGSELVLTGREIAAEIGYEPSGIGHLVKQGLPVHRHTKSRRLFRLEPVLIWLMASGRTGRSGRDYPEMLREHRRQHGRDPNGPPPIRGDRWPARVPGSGRARGADGDRFVEFWRASERFI